ncbi:hypothetical protein [Tumebacillus permanentifrigoris]|uniref:HEPN domain-containing protein n=1 Tax=Tumebacillus permanentifrigoris TaxID=378543 RepID=A0A316DAD4_9BACL|nr:hypothetical protein [Tumebacillus permanentifrigoris]PWK14338.1 hypothetical protein C7459_10593 [Tumebacillus permanentifrigoris]
MSKVEMQAAFATMQENWQRMQSSDFDNAAEDAERFEGSFYKFTEAVQAWIKSLEEPKPHDLAAVLELPEIQAFSDELPTPLMLNFETELELMMEGITREPDEKYE